MEKSENKMIKLKHDSSEEMEQTLLNKLEDFNRQRCSFFKQNTAPFRRIGIYAYEEAKLLGGVYATIDETDWLCVQYLYIEEDCRGKKLGVKLMAEIEKLAHDEKCFGIRVETWSFQALGFYLKLGYQIFGKLKDCPPGSTEFHLKKVL